MTTLKALKTGKKGKLTEFEKILANYKEEYLTIFIVYFGDSNFNIFNKEKYQVENIQIYGNWFKVRIFVFYISKQALIETFRSVNKIQNLEYINDLVIQFYELKREKQRRKRNRENNQIQKQQDQDYRRVVFKIMGICGLVGLGYAIKKIFVWLFYILLICFHIYFLFQTTNRFLERNQLLSAASLNNFSISFSH